MSRKPTHILVPTDFSDSAAVALEYAVELCRLSGARLTLLHVTNRAKIEEGLVGLDSLHYLHEAADTTAERPPGEIQWERVRESARQKLEASIDPSWKDIELTIDTDDGYPSEAITRHAKENGVDLIVMGTQGRGRVAQFVMGSVTQNVVRLAECPVLTVKKPVSS
ncbi:MAG: universal stress protein [Planctomycetaceae bacterium]